MCHDSRLVNVGNISKKATILVVDDEEDLCWAFRTFFKDREFNLVTITTGEAAVKEVKRFRFPVVILNILLPGIDGFETAKLIREESPNTSIIIMSGYYFRNDDKIREGLRSQLFSEFLSKPFDFVEVLKTLKHHFKPDD